MLILPRRQRKPEAARRNGRRAVPSTKEWCVCTETGMIRRRRRSFRIPHLREIPLRWAAAFCRWGKLRLCGHRHSAVLRNFAWARKNPIGWRLILPQRNTAQIGFCRNFARAKKTRLSGNRFCVSGGLRLTEESENWSAEYLGLPWKQKFGQRTILACRVDVNLLSG